MTELKKQAPSFTKNFLQNHTHELVKLIARAREINKAHTTFIDTILKHEHKGRIHAEINQLRSDQGGTVTGRFSYAIQTYSRYLHGTRNLDHGLDRCLYLKKVVRGVVFDYSQQEPRLVVHYAALQDSME